MTSIYTHSCAYTNKHTKKTSHHPAYYIQPLTSDLSLALFYFVKNLFFKSDTDSILIAPYYVSTMSLPSIQEKNERAFQIIEVRVLTNWGHPEYTCLYRFRVHGEPRIQ